jgi:hypothetical protein
MYKLIVIAIVFLLGLYFITQSNKVETFTSADIKIAENCSDVLIQKGAELFLYNSKRLDVPGVNPIKFANLEEYVEFTEWQRSQGILCPVLFLQHAYDAQNNDVYKARLSPTDLRGGVPDLSMNPRIMPAPSSYPVQGAGAPPIYRDPKNAAGIESQLIDATRDGKPYNQNDYPGFDAHDLYIGLTTPLDKLFNEPLEKISANPMDTNWGGAEFTQSLVDTGYYKDNEVSRSTAMF